MLFIDSTAQATRHGVYAIERTPPTTIQPVGATQVAIVEQFPWGPSQVVTEVTDMNDFFMKFCPPGSDRASPGFMTVAGKAWPILKIVRVLGDDAAEATATINKTGPTAMLTVTLKYKGELGNSVTWETTAATDGDANHFNLIVTLEGTSGTTQDKFHNLNYSGTGSDSDPDCTNCLLVGSIEKIVAGVPLITTGTFSGGDDDSPGSTDYVGTQGDADKGIALLESDLAIDMTLTGDPGDTDRAAVNAGLKAHVDYMTDRIAFINGDSGMSLSDVQTDVESYRSLRVIYVDNWAYQRDGNNGTEQLVPPAPFVASCAANLSPSTSFSWKSVVAQKYFSAITKLETNRGNGAYTNELKGICTLQKEINGGYTVEAAVNTAAPTAPAKKSYKRTRMGHYMAKSIKQSMRESVDSPNVPFNQQDEIHAVSDFLETLKANATIDPNGLPHILGFSIKDLKAFNSQADLDQGKFTIPFDAKISSDQEKIFLSMNFGETVKVEAQL